MVFKSHIMFDSFASDTSPAIIVRYNMGLIYLFANLLPTLACNLTSPSAIFYPAAS